jgi:signal transduction histidine kinase
VTAGSPGRPREHRIAEEQAALRRVAVLVARAAPPGEVFTAVTEEAGRLLGAGHAAMSRYDPDGAVTVVAAWSSSGPAIPVGTRMSLGGRNVHTLVFEQGRAARLDDYADVSGAAAEVAREFGIRAAIGVPISVEGRLWGLMSLASTRERPLPADTEVRLAGFTELAATAIASVQARVELRGFAEEQAALHRVATLVARGAPPEEVFATVAAEAGRVLAADVTGISRYDPDGMAAAVGGWSGTGDAVPFPVGTRVRLGGRNVVSLVFETGRPARIDRVADASGHPAAFAREREFGSVVGAPITVEGRLWGVIMVISTSKQPLPPGTEARLAGFTELTATAIANTQARVELRGFAEEQAALRRVATLVVRAAPWEEVFAAVAAEAGQLLSADATLMSRYEPDDAATIVGAWASTGDDPAPLGMRLSLGGRDLHTLVFQSGQPARIDDYGGASDAAADIARKTGVRSAAGVPISVEGRLWGVIGIASGHELPPDTEARLAGFTELIATAIANTEAQAALTASRARIVATADQTRRRIERDLHDGAQQRLVSLALQLREAQAAAPPGAGELAQRLDGAVAEVNDVLEGLREIARGIHPAVLTESGLRPALRALARRSAVPVSLDVQVPGRPSEPVEIAAYYAVSEALTNVAKHAHASAAEVEVAAGDGVLRVDVRDDGRGGADFGRGSGLVGLKDRVEALGGWVSLQSPAGAGTTLQIALPLDDPSRPGQPTAGPPDEAGHGPG